MEIILIYRVLSWLSTSIVLVKGNVKKLAFIILLNFIFIFINQKASSQQLPVFSQYTFNAFLLNPAVAGAEGYTAINLTSRAQWIGVEGAPLTGTVSIQSRMNQDSHSGKNKSARRKYAHPFNSGKIGIAGGFYYDRAGIIDQTSVFFSYAYHIKTRRSQLSLGATFSLLQFKVNTNLLSSLDQENINIGDNKLLIYLPDFNIGAYYTNKTMFIGLSVLQLAQGSVHFKNYSNTNNNFVIYRHFYLSGGNKFALNRQSALEPSFYLKVSEEMQVQLDATLKYIYDSKYWLGIAYRTGSTFITSLGIKIDKIYIGYAFDYGRMGVLNNSYGSHELMVALKFGGNNKQYKYLNRY
jgi:type IX secretion system PorP/SprF family membrane protein